MPHSGEIYRHDRFYWNAQGWQTKYLLILAHTPGDDVIFRLLTSRAHGRPKQPPCFHGPPYPGFYLGYLGNELTTDSWLDLRQQDDYDGRDFNRHLATGLLRYIHTLSLDLLCPVLECAANADDTTRQQERCIRDQRVALHCP